MTQKDNLRLYECYQMMLHTEKEDTTKLPISIFIEPDNYVIHLPQDVLNELRPFLNIPMKTTYYLGKEKYEISSKVSSASFMTLTGEIRDYEYLIFPSYAQFIESCFKLSHLIEGFIWLNKRVKYEKAIKKLGEMKEVKL